MDLFERLLDIISEKLATGPTTRLDSEISELEAKLERGAPAAPDTSDVDRRIDGMTAELSFAESQLPAAEAKAKEATDAYSKAEAENRVRDTAAANLKAAEAARDRRLQAKAADEAAAMLVVDEDRIEYLESSIRDAQALALRKTAYAAFLKLPSTETEWEGDEASLKAEITKETNRANAASQIVANLTADIREAQAKLVTSSVCGYCNQDFSQFPEVAKKNADLQAQITEKEASREKYRAEVYEATEAKAALQAVLDAAAPFHKFLQQGYGTYVSTDHNFVPPHIQWHGAVPEGDANPAAMQTELTNLKKALQAKQAAKTSTTRRWPKTQPPSSA
jgi:hypothetical protein